MPVRSVLMSGNGQGNYCQAQLWSPAEVWVAL